MTQLVIVIDLPQDATKVARVLALIGEQWPDSSLVSEPDDRWKETQVAYEFPGAAMCWIGKA